MLTFHEYPTAFTKPVYGEEMHGDEAKPLVSIYIEAVVNADALEAIKPGLRDALFKRPAVNDSERLVDGEAVNLIRRFTTMEPVRLADDWPGYTMIILGDLIDESREWADVELGKLSIEPQDGGTAKLKVRAQMRGEGLEFWVGMMNRAVSLTLTPPKAEPLPAEHPDASADEHQEQLPIGEGNAPNVDPFSGANLSETRDPDESTVDVAATKRRARKANGAEVRT